MLKSNTFLPKQPFFSAKKKIKTIKFEFCCLGDVIGQAGGCTDAVTARIGSAWKAFHELLPILTNRGISLANRGKVFKACVRTVLLYGSET